MFSTFQSCTILPNSKTTLKGSILYISIILVVGAVGLLSPFQYNLINATLVFEILLLSLLLFGKLSISGRYYGLILVIFFYMLYGFFSAVIIKDADYFDFFLAYKVYAYLLLLTFLQRPSCKVFKITTLITLFRGILFLSIIKYSYVVLFGTLPRPGIFTENNFELLLVLLFGIITWGRRGYSPFFEWISVILIIFLSGSRSAAIAAIPLLLVTKFQANKTRKYRKYLYLPISFLIIAFVASFIFLSRKDSPFDFETIDRVKFLQIFIQETQSWSFLQWFLGTNPITPLSEVACTSLSYYDKLFSHKGDGSCYSVVFHSMILRLIYDHGLFGLFFSFVIVWYNLKTSGFNNFTCLSIILVLLVNGASVSSLNSVYSAIPLALGIMSQDIIYFCSSKHKYLQYYD